VIDTGWAVVAMCAAFVSGLFVGILVAVRWQDLDDDDDL
jgi:hypothetical protein